MNTHYRNEKSKRGRQVRGESVQNAPVYTATYKVQRSDSLLEFLLRKCNTSRNNVKNLLVRKQVLVNGSVVTQYDFPLAKDDEVKLAKSPVRESESVKRAVVKKTARPQMKIIYEDDDFIAVDKPCGLLSVENEKETECAYGYVVEYLKTQGKNIRPYILHRIDKETSGVLVFAKNIKLHSMLKMAWNEFITLREYVAIAEGVFEKKEDTIVSYLKENVNKLMYSTNDIKGQKAITHFEVMKESAQYSMLRVRIDTGRKNQIRVHMQDMEHPIVGDDKYGHTKNPLNRLGLHASKLAFIHPVTKQVITLQAPIPSCFHTLFAKK